MRILPPKPKKKIANHYHNNNEKIHQLVNVIVQLKQWDNKSLTCDNQQGVDLMAELIAHDLPKAVNTSFYVNYELLTLFHINLIFGVQNS